MGLVIGGEYDMVVEIMGFDSIIETSDNVVQFRAPVHGARQSQPRRGMDTRTDPCAGTVEHVISSKFSRRPRVVDQW